MYRIIPALVLALVVTLTGSAAPAAQDTCLSPSVSVSPVDMNLGQSLAVTGTVANHCSGSKRVNFELSVNSPCTGYHILLYQFGVTVPGNGVYTQTLTYTPDCAGTWDAYNAFLYKNSFALEDEKEFIVH